MLVDKEQVLKAKAKLGDKNADIIAELLHLEKYDAVNKKALCPWHLEDTPSFIYDSKRYCWHCFGCSKNTDIIDAYMFTGLTYLEAVQKLFEEAKMNIALGEKGVKTKYQYRYPHEEPINDKEHVYAYLEKRGISKATVDAVDIREDEHGNIVFNYYDSNDVLCLVKYRPSHKIDKSAGEIKSWCQKGADTTPLLFNMNRINVDQPLLLTEGECMPGNAEVLTPNGWIRLDEYNNEQVLQINTDLTGNFVTPLAYIKHEYDGDLYIDRKNNFASVTTANHNIVYIDYKGYLRKRKASEMPGIGTGFIPTVTKVNGEGIPFTNDQIALYLAISADCTIDVRKTTRHSRFSVKKDRKYFRLKELLERLNIPFFENKSTNRDGYKYIGFTTPDWVVSKTLPFEWIGQATLEQRKFIIEEMTYWDGNRVKTRKERKTIHIGDKFNLLTVIEPSKVVRKENGKIERTVLCQCECGNKITVKKIYLLENIVKSCGCLKHKSHSTTHGESQTRLYNIWINIKSRCYNPKTSFYELYGGRGIKMAPEWVNDYLEFKKWALLNGYKEIDDKSRCTIDRIDNDGDYTPANCRWVNMKVQCNNRSSCNYITRNEKTLSLKEWCEYLNIPYKSVFTRISQLGWDVERALTTPFRTHKPYKNSRG